jgi:alkylated DNA repair protein alkB family protein 8
VSSLRLDAAKGAVVLQRYYHLFEEGELDGLVRAVPTLRVLDSFYDRSNWCVVFSKQQPPGTP